MASATGKEHWADRAAQKLEGQATRLRDLHAPSLLIDRTFALHSLETETDEAVADVRANLASPDRAIYLIELQNSSDSEPIRTAFRKYKLEYPEDKLARDNRAVGRDSSCLYVGSSFQTASRKHTLAARLKQHLIGCSKSTYALKMLRWVAPSRSVWDIEIKFHAYQFRDCNLRHDLVAIEDELAAELNPLFGKRGSL